MTLTTEQLDLILSILTKHNVESAKLDGLEVTFKRVIDYSQPMGDNESKSKDMTDNDFLFYGAGIK